MKNNSKIYVQDIWLEQLFEFIERSINMDGGDGGAVLCCKNYYDVRDMYKEWYEFEFQRPFAYDESRIEDNAIYCYCDQENLIFTDDPTITLWPKEITFIVIGDCISTDHNHNGKKAEAIEYALPDTSK